MIIEEIQGDLLETPLRYIAHGVNCRGKMGSGVAKAILDRYPEVKESYLEFYENGIHLAINGQENFLGSVQPVETHDGKIVFNCFTQENFGYDGSFYVDYDSVRNVFETLAIHFEGKDIAIPRIGCGLAGGDWNVVRRIINEATKDKLNVYVYYLEY